MDALLLRTDGKIEKLSNRYGDKIRIARLPSVCMNYDNESILETLPINYKECSCAFTIDHEFGIYPEDPQMTIKFEKKGGEIKMAWTYWTSDSTSTATSSNSYWDNNSTTADYTWNRWQTCTITSTSASSATITTWGEWQNDKLRVYEYERPLTQEEKERNEQERIRMEEVAREQGERRKKEERKQKEADEKALSLLEENLSEDQRQVFKETGVIPVQCQSGRKYHIRKGISQNVHELDEKGGTKRRLCFHPSGVPLFDVMLAQKLILETDEELALRVANFS